jgi:hypothetical protein
MKGIGEGRKMSHFFYSTFAQKSTFWSPLLTLAAVPSAANQEKRACRGMVKNPPAGPFGYLKLVQALRIPRARFTKPSLAEGVAQFQEKNNGLCCKSFGDRKIKHFLADIFGDFLDFEWCF